MPASLRSDGVRDHPGMLFGFPPDYAFSVSEIPIPPENVAPKLSHYEDLLQRHKENSSKEITLGPLHTLNRGIFSTKAYVQRCDESLLLVSNGAHISGIH